MSYWEEPGPGKEATTSPADVESVDADGRATTGSVAAATVVPLLVGMVSAWSPTPVS